MVANAHRESRDPLSDELKLMKVDVRAEMNRLRDTFETHGVTKADLHAMETRLVKWMLGLMLSSLSAAVIISVALGRLST